MRFRYPRLLASAVISEVVKARSNTRMSSQRPFRNASDALDDVALAPTVKYICGVLTTLPDDDVVSYKLPST